MKKSSYIWIGVVVVALLISGAVLSNSSIFCDNSQASGKVVNVEGKDGSCCAESNVSAMAAHQTYQAKYHSSGSCPATGKSAQSYAKNGKCPYTGRQATMATKEKPDKEVLLTQAD